MARWTPLPQKIPKLLRKTEKNPRSKAGAPQSPPRPPNLAELPEDCDPYLRWAVLTQWRGYARGGAWAPGGVAHQTVRIIAQGDDAAAIKTLSQHAQVPRFYLQPLNVSTKSQAGDGGRNNTEPVFSCHATASLKVSELVQLFQRQPGLRWELAAPLRDQTNDKRGTAVGYLGPSKRFEARDSLFKTVKPARTSVGKSAVRGGTVAVIDFGCPLLHECLRHPAQDRSRLVALWDQGDQRVTEPWSTPSAAGYGGELGRTALSQAWHEARSADFPADEAAAYAGLNYLIDYQDPRQRVYPATHGAHVLDLAGGVINPANGLEDAASKARLVFVQLPFAAAGDSSGGSLGAHVLDALRYVMHVASPDDPLVVNISYGSTAGPHDGSSLIERAIDELLEHRQHHTAVVLAAGNARQAGLHARRAARKDHNALFRLAVAPDDSTDTFVEFWFPRRDEEELELRVRLPNGDWSNWVGPDAMQTLVDSASGDCTAALIHQRRVPNGRLSLALLALRPTATPQDDDGSLAESGLWEVEARLRPGPKGAARPCVWIEGRVERDDPPPYSGHRQTRFVGLETTDADNTLSSIATGSHTVVVGGFRGSDGVEVAYSATGPRRTDQWPLAHALCERDTLQQGLHAAAVRSTEQHLMNGTSVAAPVLARQIYNLLHEAMTTGLKKPLDRAGLQQQLSHRALQPDAQIRFQQN